LLAVLHRLRHRPGRGLRTEDRRRRLAAAAQPPDPPRPAGTALVQAADRGRAVGPRLRGRGRCPAVPLLPLVRGDPRLLRHRPAVDPLAAAAVGTHPRAAALGQPAAGGRTVVVDLRPRRLRQPAAARDPGRGPRAVHLGPALAPAAGTAGPAGRGPAAALERG